MTWEKVRLGDIADCIQPGPFGSQLHSSDYSESGTPIIMPKDMINGRISHADLLYVGEDHVRRLKRHQVHEGNIMVARKGDVRKCVFITDNEDGWMTGSDCLKVALNEAVCFPKFIYYQLRSPFIGKWLETISIGATMPSLNTGLLSGIELVLPPYATQKRISDILSAYDDLIENNQKQIKLLEEAAQRLYKEWFIDLRFPGHESTPIVNGLPEGWTEKHAEDFFEMTIGKTPPRAEVKWFLPGDSGIPWVSITDMGSSGAYILKTDESLSSEAITSHNVKVIPKGTILLSFKLTVGRVSITTKAMCTNEAIAHFRVDDETRGYTYLYLKDFEYEKLGNTSAISKAVNSKIVKAMPFIMPDNKTLASFAAIVNPLLNEIYNRQYQNLQLVEARDRLLPRLVSRELEV